MIQQSIAVGCNMFLSSTVCLVLVPHCTCGIYNMVVASHYNPLMFVIEPHFMSLSFLDLPLSWLSPYQSYWSISPSIHVIDAGIWLVTCHDISTKAFAGIYWFGVSEVGRPTGVNEGINVFFAPGAYLLHAINRTWTLFCYSHPLLMTTFRQDVYERGF